MKTITANEQLYLEARALYENHRYAEAIEKYTPAAEQGDALLQFVIGDCYCSLDGKENRDKGNKWYERAVENLKIAAAQGSLRAYFLVGDCYRHRRGVKMDNLEAMKWYAKAVEGFQVLADKGDAEAQYMLGWCYCREQGVKPDNDKTFAYFEKAALQGHPFAQCMLAWCYMCHIGAEVDDEKCVYWADKAAAQGVVEGMDYLGWYCFYGRAGEGRGYPEAFVWLKKAVENGSVRGDTLELLATCYWKGLGTEKDVPKAIKYLEIVCGYGYRSARDMLEEIGDEGYDEAYDAIDRAWDEF